MSTVTGTIRIRVAAIIQRGDSILLVRHAKEGRTYWMLPGGGVDFGERLDDALVRELREEAGLEIRPQRLVLVTDAIAPGNQRHILNLCFTADLISGEPVVGTDERVVEVAFQPIDKLPTLPLYPDFGEALAQALRDGFREIGYLGNFWI